MRKRTKRTVRPLQSWLPKNVMTDIEIMSFYFADKLSNGTFDAVDSNTVAYLLNVANKLALEHGHTDMEKTTDKAIAAYLGIRKRKDRTGKYGASGEELLVLRETMPAIAEYFATRPQHHIEEARLYVLRVNEKMRKAGMMYAEPTKQGTFENVVMA